MDDVINVLVTYIVNESAEDLHLGFTSRTFPKKIYMDGTKRIEVLGIDSQPSAKLVSVSSPTNE